MSLHEHDAEKLKFDLMLGIVISQLILVLRYTPDYSTFESDPHNQLPLDRPPLL
jgi:hypothetical protein